MSHEGEEPRYAINKPRAMTIREAGEILGKDFFGPEAVKKTWGVELTTKEVPPIPWSPEELHNAKRFGEMLVLRIDRDQEGKPLTMRRMYDLLKPRFKKEGKGDILNGGIGEHYKDEQFFFRATPRLEWRLVSKEILPGSKNKDYVEQTRLLRDHLHHEGFLDKKDFEEASDHKLDEMSKKISELKKGHEIEEIVKKLAELGVNKKHRRRPVEVLYDLLLVFEANNARLLEATFGGSAATGSYDCTVGFFSKMIGFVGIGNFCDLGVSIFGVRPNKKGKFIGVCSSR